VYSKKIGKNWENKKKKKRQNFTIAENGDSLWAQGRQGKRDTRGDTRIFGNQRQVGDQRGRNVYFGPTGWNSNLDIRKGEILLY